MANKIDMWGVSECMRGNYTVEQQQPDPDLGKTLKPGWKNEPKKSEPNRVFAVPTIRKDIPIPGQRSISDNNNYGNETDARGYILFHLLFLQ